ncbi:MAG: polymer-forming cytoskeletal protein [Tepidisphaeraceae bacterium]
MTPPGEIQLRPEDRQTIVCLYCGKSQEVALRAITVTCRFCVKPLKLQDVPVKDYQARRQIDTCGIVIVEKKGHVVAERILCGGLVARGRVKGNITSRGPVLVGPEAEIRGDVVAPTLAVGAGAVLHGYYKVGQKDTNYDDIAADATQARPGVS